MLNRQQTAATNKRYTDATVVIQELRTPLHLDQFTKSNGLPQLSFVVQNETVPSNVAHVVTVSAVTSANTLTTLTKNNANTAEADIKG